MEDCDDTICTKCKPIVILAKALQDTDVGCTELSPVDESGNVIDTKLWGTLYCKVCRIEANSCGGSDTDGREYLSIEFREMLRTSINVEKYKDIAILPVHPYITKSIRQFVQRTHGGLQKVQIPGYESISK
jgi:hypothetical protein